MSYPQRAEAQMSQYRTAFTTAANLVLCCLANSHTSWNNLPFVWGGNTNFEKAERTQTLHCSYLASTHSPRYAYLHCPAHWRAHRLAVPIVGHPRITTSVRSSMRFRRASVSSYALNALHKSFAFSLIIIVVQTGTIPPPENTSPRCVSINLVVFHRRNSPHFRPSSPVRLSPTHGGPAQAGPGQIWKLRYSWLALISPGNTQTV